MLSTSIECTVQLFAVYMSYRLYFAGLVWRFVLTLCIFYHSTFLFVQCECSTCACVGTSDQTAWSCMSSVVVFLFFSFCVLCFVFCLLLMDLQMFTAFFCLFWNWLGFHFFIHNFALKKKVKKWKIKTKKWSIFKIVVGPMVSVCFRKKKNWLSA